MSSGCGHTGGDPVVAPFAETLTRHGLSLVRGRTHTLQVNVGCLCDLACRHCHLEAGPERAEVMSRGTMDHVIDFAARVGFETIDVTGGAPELVPDIRHLVGELRPLARRLIVRTNLVALHSRPDLMAFYRDCGMVIVASLPSTNASQADAQRGRGVWEKSVGGLKALNGLGYGLEGSNLQLDLVANPAGAFLPGDQGQLERKFRRDLGRQGVFFHSLYSFANAPIGRFHQWLQRSGNLGGYMEMLAGRFNPATVQGLMCRTLLSVSWDGYLYDCDFNLAVGLHHGRERTHVASLAAVPPEGYEIPTGDHCYACTAGSGFT